jgi:integrase
VPSLNKRVRADGGTSYQVRFVVGGGRPAPGSVWAAETFTDEALARRFMDDVRAAGENWPTDPYTGRPWIKGRGYGVEQPQAPRGPSLAEVAEAYFSWSRDESVDQLRTKAIASWERDKRIYELHIEPTFGDRAFGSIDTDLIASWRREQLTGCAPKTWGNRHGLLFSIMKHGQPRMKLRADNPCEATTMPRRENDNEVRFFQHGEWTLFKSCLRSDVHLLCEVKLASAVRWGEISALRVGDCMLADEQTVHMHITRAWKARGETDPTPVNRDEDETGNWRLGPPKNGRSRWVTVQGDVALELIAAVQGRHPDEYVFRTTRGNPWRYDDFHSDRWAPAMKLAKERGLTKHMTPHMLRHTAVVWAVAAGVPLTKVSTMLGHASIGITYDRYGGLLNVQDDEMAAAMARELLRAKDAIVPGGHSQDQIDARPVRTRPRRRGGPGADLRSVG